jgi:Putative DNA-binding domain
MAIMWSRIHAELGLSPGPLTHDMVARAVAQHLRENDDLDWKQDLAWKKKDLPPDEKEKKKREFAKDVAAMANTRGGLIVFGVSEQNEEAVDLPGVLNDERERQNIRSLAWQRVRPLIDGLVIEPLNDEAGGQGLIVVSVPSSPDSPHIVGEKNEMGVPYRDGSDTRWMTEGQLERAYRDRFARRADDRAALSGLIDSLIPEIDLQSGIWVGVSARPIAPLPPTLDRPQANQATSTMNDMLRLSAEILGNPVGGLRMLRELPNDAVLNPRNGLRRWVIRSNRYSTDPHEQVDWAVVELHHDGCVALAVGLGNMVNDRGSSELDPNVRRVPYRFVDVAIADAVALIVSHVRSLGGAGPILIRAELLRDGHDTSPMIAVDNRDGPFTRASFTVQVPGSRPVRQPVAVEAQFSADDDVTTLRGSARQLADDLDQQFGLKGSTITE